MSNSPPNDLKSMEELTRAKTGEFSSLDCADLSPISTQSKEKLFAFQIYLLNHHYETRAFDIFKSQKEHILSNKQAIYKDFLILMKLEIEQNKKDNKFKEIDFDERLMNFFDFWCITQERQIFYSSLTEKDTNDKLLKEVDKI